MPEALQQNLDNNILTLTLNRPEVRNALSKELMNDLRRALCSAEENEQVRVIVLLAAGEAFCAGLDLSELQHDDQSYLRNAAMQDCFFDLLQSIQSSSKPFIAVVQGPAVAGGATLLSVCDIVLASEQASIGFPGIRRGLAPAVVIPFLHRQLGNRLASYLLVSGEMLNARRAHELGLVDEIVPQGDLLSRCNELASQVSSFSLRAIALIKRWQQEATPHKPDQIKTFCKRFYVESSPDQQQ